jgi:hypothetical protein
VYQVFVCGFSRSFTINENVYLILMGFFRTAYKKLLVVLQRLQKKGKQTFTILYSFHFISWISISGERFYAGHVPGGTSSITNGGEEEKKIKKIVK